MTLCHKREGGGIEGEFGGILHGGGWCTRLNLNLDPTITRVQPRIFTRKIGISEHEEVESTIVVDLARNNWGRRRCALRLTTTWWWSANSIGEASLYCTTIDKWRDGD